MAEAIARTGISSYAPLFFGILVVGYLLSFVVTPKTPPADRITTTPEEVVDKRKEPEPAPAPPGPIVGGGNPVDCDELEAKLAECEDALIMLPGNRDILRQRSYWRTQICKRCKELAAEWNIDCNEYQ